MKRRDFFKIATATAGALSISSFPRLFADEINKKYASDIVLLGRTGIKVSLLAMGTGTNGYNMASDQTKVLGMRGLSDLLRSAYDHGINFWDTADAYGTHPHVREALKSVPREKVVILTKTTATTADQMKSDLDRFRKELGTDYLDILLLHMMMDEDWPKKKQGAMEVLSKARDEGVIRAHGVSCHTLEALESASTSDWVQIDLARINPDRARMDAAVPTVVNILRKMHEDGKAIVGMKIFGGGELRGKPDECLRFTLHLDCIDAFTIGQQSEDELLDLLRRIPAASISS